MNRRQFLISATSAAGMAATAARAAEPPVKRVLVMFKCHLDVGFVDTQAAIINRYFQQFFPQAIQPGSRSARGRRRGTLRLDHRFVAHLSISRAGRRRKNASAWKTR